MKKWVRNKRGQFVIIAALIIAALTLATVISIYEININIQSIAYKPVNEFLLGTTSDMNRALTVALANYTDGIINQNLTEAVANLTASQFMTTWKESLLTSYSSYGIRINPSYDMTPRFEIGPWSGNTPWNGSSTFSFAYIPYGFDVDSYGFKGWVGATEKYVQLQIFSETVKTNWPTGPTSLIFQLTQSEVNGNYSTPIPDLPPSPDNATFRIETYNTTSQSFNPTSPSNLIYLGGGNYSVTFNQAIDPIHNGVRLDLATPEDKIWISAFNYNYDPVSSNTATQLSNSAGGTLLSPATVTLGQSVNDSVTVTGLDGSPEPTGTVRFEYRLGTSGPWTAFDNKTLVSGSASSGSFAPPSAGTWYFRAVYLGDDDYSGSQSGDANETLTVNRANSTVVTLLSPATVTLGQSVTDSANVTGLGGGYPVPTGNVTFQVSTDGGSNWTAFGDNKTLSGGSATSDSYTPMAASGDSVSYFFRANYLGDSNYNLNQSGPTDEPLTVNKATPIVGTSLSPANVTLGGLVNDSVTVTGLGGGYPVPTGTVTFQVSTNNGSNWSQFGAVKTLDGSGFATSDSYNASATFTYYFMANYSGDSNYLSSQSGPTDEPLTVNRATPTVGTSLSPATITFGQNITDTATVSGVVGGPTPTGTATFQVSTNGGSNWTAFGAVKTLSGGSAISDSYTPFSAGTYNFRAVYSGDANYASAASGQTAEPLTVNKATPTVGTLLSAMTITLGGSVTDNVTVAGLGGGYPVPTGTVTFQVSTNNGSNWSQFGAVKTLDGSGRAVSDSYVPFSAGTWYFRAVYSGDANYASAASGQTAESEELLTVNMGSSTTGTSLFPATITFGQSITDTATVSGVVGGPTPTGTATFQVSTNGGSNWTAFGAVKTLSGGSAISDSYTPFSAGTYNFRAVYSGDSNYLSSQSGPTDEPLTVSITSGTLGTYYVSYDPRREQNFFLTNSTNLPPLDEVNPELGSGHPSVNITSSNPVPSIVTSSTIYITCVVQVRSSQTIQIQLGFYYLGNYYLIGIASFNAIGVNGNPPPAYYTVSIPVPGKTFVSGFPVQAIPAGSQIVLTTTLLTPKNRVDMYGGMGGTRIVFF